MEVLSCFGAGGDAYGEPGEKLKMSNKSIEPKNPAKSPPFPPQLLSQTSIGIEIHSFEHDLGCAGRRKAALIVLRKTVPQKPGEPHSGHQ
jgi:hypothetical protein